MLLASVVSLPTTVLPPIAVGFMGLGTGYLIYGTQEFFGYPKRDKSVDEGMGVWGIWMPGFMQFLTGFFLLAGLTIFGNYSGAAYMAGLAFTAYGVHWFVIGWNRARGVNPRVNIGMAVAFLLISILGMIVFFDVKDYPVGGLFLGLTLVYITDIAVTLKAELPSRFAIAEKVLGFLHLGVGLWLMYLMFAATLTFAIKSTIPL